MAVAIEANFLYAHRQCPWGLNKRAATQFGCRPLACVQNSKWAHHGQGYARRAHPGVRLHRRLRMRGAVLVAIRQAILGLGRRRRQRLRCPQAAALLEKKGRNTTGANEGMHTLRHSTAWSNATKGASSAHRQGWLCPGTRAVPPASEDAQPAGQDTRRQCAHARAPAPRKPSGAPRRWVSAPGQLWPGPPAAPAWAAAGRGS
jgi:hypothetical protein